MQSETSRAFFDSFYRMTHELARLVPAVLMVLAILIVGAMIASIVRFVVGKLLGWIRFDRLAASSGFENAILRTGVFRSPSDFGARVAQGAVWLMIVLLALSATGAKFAEDLVTRFANFVPDLITAGLVLLLGSVVSKFLARSALLAAVNAQWPGARAIAGAVRVLVMSLAVVVALEQLRIGRSALLITFGTLFGGVVLAGAIAFGLGARDLAREWLREKTTSRPPEGEEVLHHL